MHTRLLAALTLCALAMTALADDYATYRQPGLDNWRIGPEDIAPLFPRLQANPLFAVTELGHSFNGQPIRSVTVGTGPTRVLLWSQMHGDEPTATAALFDLFNRIAADADWRASWQQRLTLVAIPMLNPDGAATFDRYNAQGIDINRDASALQTPEGRILMATAQELKPQFGFNLHDQSRRYRAGSEGGPATISLLAPAYDHARSINDSRRAAMLLIAGLLDITDAMLPGNVGRYDDSYSHRAFGDTLSGLGISTVLVESGGYPGDPHRQVAREVNYRMLVRAIDDIASGAWQQADIARYEAIPLNADDAWQDLVLRDVTVGEGEPAYRVDIAIDQQPYSDRPASIRELGDLSSFGAYSDVAARGLRYQPGKAYTLPTDDTLALDEVRYRSLLAQGYSHFVGDAERLAINTRLPVALNPERTASERPQRGGSGFFLLADARGVAMAILDGEPVALRQAP